MCDAMNEVESIIFLMYDGLEKSFVLFFEIEKDHIKMWTETVLFLHDSTLKYQLVLVRSC